MQYQFITVQKQMTLAQEIRHALQANQDEDDMLLVVQVGSYSNKRSADSGIRQAIRDFHVDWEIDWENRTAYLRWA
jgi:hypothetical protein